MDSILKALRVQGKHFVSFSFFTIITLSLAACSDNGPGDDGEGNASANDSQANTTQGNNQNLTAANSAVSSTQGVTSSTASDICQQQNLLVCETFEWSSSLAYQASNSDWSVNGWQFSAANTSGLFCDAMGVNGSQCALKWTQSNSGNNSLQKATKVFSEYGAAENRVTMIWNAKWPSVWQWAASSPFVKLGIFDRNQVLQTVASLNIDSRGIAQLVLSDDYVCPGQQKIVKAGISNALDSSQLGKWHTFKLVYDAATSSNNVAVTLTMNDEVLVSTVSIDLSCGTNTDNVKLNAISFVASQLNTNSTLQSMLVDNVTVSYL